MFKVYITKSKLVDIFIDESDKPNAHSEWFKVLCAQNEIALDSYNVEDELNIDSPLAIVSQNLGSLQFVQSDIFEYIKNEDYCKVLECNPCGAYIIDENPEVAKMIREDYGVICESTDGLKETFLTVPGHRVQRENNGKTWARFPFGANVPTNTLIIQDRFFFNSDSGESIDDTFENYENIIRTLLPDHFSITSQFHLLVIVDGTKIQARDNVSFKDVAKHLNYIKEQIEQERNYNILLEVLSIPEGSYHYRQTHNRRILSNYYWIEAPHKLKAFRKNKNLATQTLSSRFLFTAEKENQDNNAIYDGDESDSDELNHSNWIAAFRDIVDASFSSGQYGPKNRRNPPIVYDCHINDISSTPSNLKNRILV